MMCSEGSREEVKDLIDFYRLWPDMRNDAVSLQNDPRLEPHHAFMIKWMILVVDRVGPADLDTRKD